MNPNLKNQREINLTEEMKICEEKPNWESHRHR